VVCLISLICCAPIENSLKDDVALTNPSIASGQDFSFALRAKVMERNTDTGRYICVNTYRDINYSGDFDRQCLDPNVCKKVASGLDVSSITMYAGGRDYCFFYDQDDCGGQGIVLTESNPDLRTFDGQNWNDQIRSYKCGHQSGSRDLDVRAPTDVSTSTEQQGRICIVLWKDTLYRGDAIHTCNDPNTCWRVSVPDFGISSVKGTPGTNSWCMFFDGLDCNGQAMALNSEEEAPDLNHFGTFDLNWNDRIRSYRCGYQGRRRGLSIRAPAEVSTSVEKRDRICIVFYEHNNYHGDSVHVCIDDRVCFSTPTFGISSIKRTHGNELYCNFWDGQDCKGKIMTLTSEEEVADLDTSGDNWNDRIRSYKCGWNAVWGRRDLIIRAPTDVSTSVEKRDKQICLIIYEDTEFHGESIDGCVDASACVFIKANDGSQRQFGISSIKMTRLFLQNDGPHSECFFYEGQNCDGSTFSLSSDQDALDLNHFGALDQNWNDHIQSFSCGWQARRRDLSERAESTKAATSNEMRTQVCHVLYSDINYGGRSDLRCLERSECRNVDPSFGISSFTVEEGGYIVFMDGECGRPGLSVWLDHNNADFRSIGGDDWNNRVRSYRVGRKWT
jgi:hypothetical protein